MAIVRNQDTYSFAPRSYDVFLSFGGEEIGKTFTDHLYEALSGGAGLHTFRDDEGMGRREHFDSELEKTIKAARSSIIVFSKDYASSRCCLDELVLIIEHKRISEHVILPVFYDVVPSQVRHQTGSFAEAFGKHEGQLMMETNEMEREDLRNKVEGWRKALREVANLAGMDLRNDANGFESIFIKKIIEEIVSKLYRPVLDVAPYLIGMEHRVKNINLWLRDESAGNGILVIYGIGGIGKTTIAKYVYNLNCKRFDSSSFLANIRETSEQYNGLVDLQSQLLSSIFKRDEKNISNVDEGIIRIEHALSCKKVLLVLDDVDEQRQLDSLIGMHKWFHTGSKIIVTSRKMNLLKRNEVDMVYKVENCNDRESLELFSWYAFGQTHPKEEYAQHSEKVVRHCGGLPLALQVLGSSLFDKNKTIWESALQKLAVIPESKILQKLKISYDSLEDDDTRRLFLYIAGFFIGEGKDFTVKILDGCGFFTIIGMENLIDRCLLTINHLEKLSMHQQLQDMAREIVRQESPKEPGKRSLSLHHEDSYKILNENTGTSNIEGLYLEMHMLENSKWFNETFGTLDTKRPRFEEPNGRPLLADEGHSLKRRCLSFNYWFPVKNAARSSNQVELKMDSFARMPKLRLLKLNSVPIEGGFKDFPKELRWLSWHRFPLNSIPSDFRFHSLVALDLSHSKLEHVSKAAKLPTLKFLNLSHCHDLTRTPHFTVFPNLEDLILEDCVHLVKVHESIGELKKLVSLNLNRCKNLKKLPSEFLCLTSLRTLNMSSCSKLDLFADGITINRTGTTSGLLKSLKFLDLSHCHGLTCTPHFTVFPNLEDLILEDCVHLVKVHESIGELKKLVSLNLNGCKNLKKLPNEFRCLTSLRTLNMSGCSKLDPSADGITINRMSTTCGGKSWWWFFNPFASKPRKSPESIYFSLATLPCSLVTIHLAKCNLSNDDLAGSLGSLSLLQHLDLGGNPIYSLPESIKFLTKLTSLKLDGNPIYSLPESIKFLTKLTSLVLFGCDRLQSLPELPMSLDILNLKGCTSLEMVTNIPNMFTRLYLFLDKCDNLVEAQGMFKFEAIGNIVLRIIEDFGLVDHLESMRSHEVKFVNNFTRSITKRPIQGLSEFGIYSLFLPSSLVPGRCNNYKKSGSIIEFNVPSNPNLKVRALKVCILYACASDERHSVREDHSNRYFNSRGCDGIMITNKAKGLLWNYCPIWIAIPDGNQDLVWLSHWKIGYPYVMEPGDEMIVGAFVSEYYQVKEVGVEIIYDEDKEEGSQHHNTYPSPPDDIDVLNLTPCLLEPGEYYLNHYRHYAHHYYYEMKLNLSLFVETRKKSLPLIENKHKQNKHHC